MKDKISDANFPMDAEGRVYHVGVRSGEVASRLLTVGDPARLHRIKLHLDAEPKPVERNSARGYTVVTGRYRGVEVSLISIGMGVAMVDFFVREVRAVTTGPLAIIRFGSCGSLTPSLPVGSIGVPQRAVQISTNYNHWRGDAKEEAYVVSKAIEADEGLQQALLKSLESTVASDTCKIKSLPLHASADCFYSTQGRIDPNFQDDNASLIDSLLASNPGCSSLEMETAHLLHLASIATPLPSSQPSIRAAAAHMVFAARSHSSVVADPAGGEGEGQPTFIDPETVAELEPRVGRACLEALVGWEL